MERNTVNREGASFSFPSFGFAQWYSFWDDAEYFRAAVLPRWISKVSAHVKSHSSNHFQVCRAFGYIHLGLMLFAEYVAMKK